MHTEEFVVEVAGQRLAATRVAGDPPGEPDILALHGFGPSATRHRIRYLLDGFAANGHTSITFDFSGNGDSTGLLTASTLRGRRSEALAVAAHLGRTRPPVVIGTSMGAHLAAWTVPELRPRGLVLFCPAAYPAGAEDLVFDGTQARPGDYPDSPAFAGIREFDGDLLIVGARQDRVVVPSIIDGYLASAHSARSTEVRWLDGDHLIHQWLPGRGGHRTDIERAILRLLAAEPILEVTRHDD